MINLNKQEFYILSVQKLQQLIEQNFSNYEKYDLIRENYWHNGACYNAKIVNDNDPENIEYGKNLTLEQIQNEGIEQAENILWCLACRRIIPFGDYLIEVYW